MMMQHVRRLLFLFLFMFSGLCVSAQSSLEKVNFAYQYDPQSEIFFTYKAYSTDSDSIALITSLFINDDNSTIENYKFQLKTSLGYAGMFQPVVFDSLYIGTRGNSHFLKFSTLKWPNNQVLTLEIESTFSGIKYYYEIQPVEIMPFKVFDGGQVPLTKSWVRSGSFMTNTDAIGLYYDYYFEPALPPMVTRSPNPQKEMIVNAEINAVNNQSFSITNEGLYLFQKDSLAKNAVPILLADKYFPKPATLNQLIDPLVYITQREEWEVFDKDSVSKREFDRFWLDISRSTDRAKKVIKTYYDRIEEANQFFTTYKEGWKTDMGMIYAVFGVPDRVIRKADKETWYYNASSVSQSIDFEFIRVNSIFSNKHYALIRDRRYSTTWYQAINNLRKVRY